MKYLLEYLWDLKGTDDQIIKLILGWTQKKIMVLGVNTEKEVDTYGVKGTWISNVTKKTVRQGDTRLGS